MGVDEKVCSEGGGDVSEGNGKSPAVIKRNSRKTVRISSVVPEFPPEYHQQQPFTTDDIPTLKVKPQSYSNSKLEKEREAKILVAMRKLSEEEEELLKENAGEITLEDDEETSFDDDPDQTVDWLADEEDFQKPAKLELVVGFLRLLCFLSVCTSVFGVVVSVLFWIQQTEKLKHIIDDVFVFKEGDINMEQFNYKKTVWKLNPYYPSRDWIFTLRWTASIIQLAYLVVNAIFVIIDSIATTTFRSIEVKLKSGIPSKAKAH